MTRAHSRLGAFVAWQSVPHDRTCMHVACQPVLGAVGSEQQLMQEACTQALHANTLPSVSDGILKDRCTVTSSA